MNRRRFLLTSGSVVGGGSLAYSQITSDPSLAADTNIQSPSGANQITENISFAFDPFNVQGENLPSSGDKVVVAYGLIDDSGVNVGTVSQSNNYSGTSVRFSTDSQTLMVNKTSISSGDYRLRVRITIKSSDGSTLLETSEISHLFT